MVGSYDGSGNYGDVLQLAGAIEAVTGLPGSPLPVVIIERATQPSHASLVKRFPALLGDAVYAYFDDAEGQAGDHLAELSAGAAPSRSILHLYGGGYLNHWWGNRKVALAGAAERLAGRNPLPLVASGQQVEEPLIVAGGAAHDAAPLLNFGPASEEPVVNLHLNGGDWVSDEPEAMIGRVIAILRRLGDVAGAPLELQPVIAYEDRRISETEALARHGEALEESGPSAAPTTLPSPRRWPASRRCSWRRMATTTRRRPACATCSGSTAA